MTRDNVSIGRSAKAAGDAFEVWIETQHEIAERLGILAHIEHNEPHSRIVGGRLIYASAGVSDYTGTLEGGLSYACEAKSTSAERFPRSKIEPKQQRHLEAVARAGGLALLLVEFRYPSTVSPPERFAVPWLKIRWQVRRTAESVGPNDLDAWPITVKPGDGDCYLSKFHPGGPRSSAGSLRQRRFARE